MLIERWLYTTLPADGYQPYKLKDLPVEIADYIRQDPYAEIMQFIVISRPVMSGYETIRQSNKIFIFPSVRQKYKNSNFMFKIKRLLLVKFPGLVKYIQRLR